VRIRSLERPVEEDEFPCWRRNFTGSRSSVDDKVTFCVVRNAALFVRWEGFVHSEFIDRKKSCEHCE
jgi:hypothetical protein